MLRFLREGQPPPPGRRWEILIRVGSVAAALYVLWIGALAQLFGNAALWASQFVLREPLGAFATWARAFTAYFHLDISIFIAITFPIAFLTTTARPERKRLAWTDVALAARVASRWRCTTSSSTTASCTGAAASRSPTAWRRRSSASRWWRW